jgi:NADPH:quinone reductase-like Zn-dependent oxidoreductase
MMYKSVVAAARGGPDVLQIVENELRPPAAGEARVRVLAVAVCQDDVAARVGNRPFLPEIPFVPGYSMIGVVDAVGPGGAGVAVGQRVAALTQFGSYAEYIYWDPQKLAPVPLDLDPAEAVPLILNYLVAYQVLHRVARVEAGDRALIVGASGGVGTAFLELGRLAGLRMYGLASRRKHHVVADYGATPIDYRTQDFVEVLRRAEPGGLDFVFNGMAEEYFRRGLAVLRRGGILVHYGGPESKAGFVRLVARLLWTNLLPDGKSIKGYGTHRVDQQVLQEDWPALFRLLAEGKIAPLIAARFPLLEAAPANALLESGDVIGNVVLLAPELL